MAISLKHAFASAKGDGPDPTRIQPSNWNAEHVLVCATGVMLGRATAGTGAVEEIASTTFGRSLLNAANASALNTLAGLGGAALLSVGTTAGTVAAGDHTHTFAQITSPPTTIAGYGITDAEQLGKYKAPNKQTGTTYTLVIGDGTAGMVEMNNASANTLTVPPNSSVAFVVDTKIDVSSFGLGQTTIAAGGGVTIHSKAGKLKLSAQYSGATLWKRATDEWVLFGDLA